MQLALKLVLSLCGFAIAWAGVAPSASAHARSVSYSSLSLRGDDIHVVVRIPRLELTRLAGEGLRETLGPAVSRYLYDHLELATDSGACELTDRPHPRANSAEGWSSHEWSVRCPAGRAITLSSAILMPDNAAHLHFARLQDSQGEVHERVLHAASPSWRLPLADTGPATSAPSEPTSLAEYIVLGIEHIATGWDHLAFVIALLLLAGSLRELVRVITGFTVAHSITLALAVLGYVRPEPAAVEAVIAFSVALVAAENSWLLAGRGRGVPLAIAALLGGLALAAKLGGSAISPLVPIGLAIFALCHFGLLARAHDVGSWRGALAFAFGLVHGFGFAGVMAELDLPVDRLAPALLGFNLGVEIGQLAVVTCAWPLLAWIARSRGAAMRAQVAELASAGIAGLGLYWLLLRAVG